MKRFLAALVAAATVAAPASARVDDGTPELLRTVDQYVTVKVDPPRCDAGGVHGSWHPASATLTLCTHGEVDAEDHDTVRHEVWHIVQTCLTPDGADRLHPVIRNSKDWDELVLANISSRKLNWIIDNYPMHHVPAEIEAYVMAEHLSASQVQSAFIRNCT